MRVVCILMQKNERRLLPVWVDYHAERFGAGNLYILDNGSDDEETLRYLREAESSGIHVDRRYVDKSDYENKPALFAELIGQIEKSDPADFYFPLDCDEFVCVEEGGGVSVRVEDIFRELGRYAGEQKVLRISAGYDNVPVSPGLYFRSPGQRKCFFYSGTFVESDHGFHESRTRAGLDFVVTKIAYIHMHYRTYGEYVEYSRQKLMGRVSDFTDEGLRRHFEAKGAGFHLILPLLSGSYQYYRNVFLRRLGMSDRHVKIEGFSEFSSRIGFCDEESQYYDADDQICGCVDSVKASDNFIDLDGWAFSKGAAGDLIYSAGIGSELLRPVSVRLYERPDVLRVHPDAALVSGFRIRFDVSNYNHETLDNFLFISSSSGKIGRPFRLNKSRIVHA